VTAALAMVCSALMVMAPVAVRAADTPDGAVIAVLDTVVAKDWDGIAPLVCEEKREEVAETFNLESSFSSDGVDAGALVDAMSLSIPDRSVTVLSEVGDTATVEMAGTLMIAVDRDGARDWIRQTLEATEQPTDDATVEQYLDFFIASLEEGEDISATVDVVRENGAWLLCDDMIGEDPGESFDPGASAPPVENPLCDLMTIEELNAATGLAFVSTSPYTDGCTWDSDFDTEYYNVSVYREEGELDFIKQVWTDGQDLTIAGLPAWATDLGTWVDLGDGLLNILPYLEGAPSTEALDPIAFAQTVGEIVVPRLS
jgi:hypothetical protein